MSPRDWRDVNIVWWLTLLGTALVATGIAKDYGISWWVGFGAGCWLLATVYSWLKMGDR